MSQLLPPETLEPRPYALDAAAFVAIAEARGFGEARRVELRGGVVIEMPSEGPLHLYVRARLTRVFSLMTPRLPAGLIWITDPAVWLADDHVVQPDFTFGDPPPRDAPYRPEALRLVIEVGVTSARYDRTTKRDDYAAAGVPHYWLIEPEAGLARLFAEPLDGAYAIAELRRAGQPLALPFAPDLSFDLAECL